MKAWKRMKALRMAFWIVWLAFLPFGVLAVTQTQGTSVQTAGTILVLAYLVLFANIGHQLTTCLCPNCGKRFFIKHRRVNLFTRRCRWCGTKPAA